jgi:hypothetical protein
LPIVRSQRHPAPLVWRTNAYGAASVTCLSARKSAQYSSFALSISGDGDATEQTLTPETLFPVCKGFRKHETRLGN